MAPGDSVFSATYYMYVVLTLTRLEPQSRYGDKPVKFLLIVVCSQNGTAVLKGLTLESRSPRSPMI